MLKNFRFASVLGVLLALAISGSASATLILSSLRYDGHVRTGATTGIEQHFTNNPSDLPPPNPGALPANNAMLPGALLDGNNLNLTMTEVPGLSILTISSPVGLVFNNTLDAAANGGFPVVFDANYYSDSLGPGEQIDINDIQFENFDVAPFPQPSFEVISAAGPNFAAPLGSINNPIRVQLGFTAAQLNDFNNGFLKVRISYGPSDMQIPEPATWGLALIAAAVASAVRRRRSA